MYGISKANMKKLQRVQNAFNPRHLFIGATWLYQEPEVICTGSRSNSGSLSRLAVLTFNCRRRSAPLYLCDLVHDYLPRRTLRSGMGWPLRYQELTRWQWSARLELQRQPFGTPFLSNWDNLNISVDLKLSLKLIFSLRVNHSHLAFWIFLDF